MSIAARANSAKELISDSEQKQIALSYLYEAWSEAQLDGVDGDCLAQAALFSALSELVNTYGEDATAERAQGKRQIFRTPVVRGELEFPSGNARRPSTIMGLFQCPPPHSSDATCRPDSGSYTRNPPPGS